MSLNCLIASASTVNTYIAHKGIIAYNAAGEHTLELYVHTHTHTHTHTRPHTYLAAVGSCLSTDFHEIGFIVLCKLQRFTQWR